MAAINFPNSPSVNDIYTENGKSFIWDGTSWKTYNTGGVDLTELKRRAYSITIIFGR